MREKKDYMVLAFERTVDSLAVEKYCQEQGLPGRIIPLPREISAGCGLSWRVEVQAYEEHLEAFGHLPAVPSKIVQLKL